MERITTSPRPHWQQTVESQGLTYYMTGDQVYWDESAYYSFTAAEIEQIETATYALNEMCLQAVEHIIQQQHFSQFLIPPEFISYIQQSWERDEHTIYGRFDLHFDGQGQPRLLEYNADTPTALLEAAVAQWFWFKDMSAVHYSLDQFNSIHERLIEAWARVKQEKPIDDVLYFTSTGEPPEDYMTVNYLRDTAIQSGLETEYIEIGDIGWNSTRQMFVDLKEKPIRHIFKLYPWEWLVREQFGRHLLVNKTQWLEAPWKMLLSNKAILPVLYNLFPDSPYLLKASFEPWAGSYIRKPIFGREGDNMTIVQNSIVLQETGGPYGNSPYIYQDLLPLPSFDGNYPVIGSWMVNGYACGLGIREDKTLITSNHSRFVPHLFRQ